MKRSTFYLIGMAVAMVLAILLFACAPAQAQGSPCAFKTGNNASVIVTDAAPGTYTAHTAAGCVGSYEHPAGAGSLALAVWADDPTTEAVDGATPGDPITLFRDGEPLAEIGPYAPDEVVRVVEVADPVILAELARVQAAYDSVAASYSILSDDYFQSQGEVAALRVTNAALAGQVESLTAERGTLAARIATVAALARPEAEPATLEAALTRLRQIAVYLQPLQSP